MVYRIAVVDFGCCANSSGTCVRDKLQESGATRCQIERNLAHWHGIRAMCRTNLLDF